MASFTASKTGTEIRNYFRILTVAKMSQLHVEQTQFQIVSQTRITCKRLINNYNLNFFQS